MNFHQNIKEIVYDARVIVVEFHQNIKATVYALLQKQ